MFDSARARPLGKPLSMVAPVAAGAVIAGGVTVLMSAAPLVWTFLVLAALLVFLPTFLLKDVRLYWAALFLFFSAIEIKKTLVDGLKVKAALGIDYIQPVLVPEVRLSDLAFGVLLFLWLLRWSRRECRVHVPAVGFLALAYLGWAALSTLKAPIPYLSWVEWTRELKFFVVFLWAANCVDSKRWLKLIAVVLACVLLTQAGMTIARTWLDLRFLGGEAFGRAGVDLAKEAQAGHLVVTHSRSEGANLGVRVKSRSFGTVPSPAGTAKHLVLLLPLIVLLAIRKLPLWARGALVLLVTVAAGALFLTFSRAGMVGLASVVALTVWFSYRQRFLRRRVIGTGVLIVAGIGVLASPILYSYWTARRDNVTIRFAQYERALRMIEANPILGVGLNNSPGLQKEYSPETSSSALGDPTKRTHTNPIHNYYMTLAAETGIVGLLLYVGFFALILRRALRLIRSDDRVIAVFSVICVVGIGGLAVSVAADPLYEDPLLVLAWLYAGVIVAMERMLGDTGAPAAAPPAAAR